LFLRSYGQNEFALPVFFNNEEKLYCNNSAGDDNSIQLFDLNQSDSFKIKEIYHSDFKVIHFPDDQDPNIQTLKNELNRVLNTFNDLSIDIISLSAIASGKERINRDSFLSQEKTNTYLYSIDEKDQLVNCLYAFPTKEWEGKHPSEETIPVENTLVLLDGENKIRGYYNGYETKEVDRLILEIRVLLSNK